MVTLLQSPRPGWSVRSPLAAQPSPGPRPAGSAPHGRGPPEHSPPSLEGPASRGTQTMGDNSWAMQRDTLNHVGPTSSPANLSYGREAAPCQGSLVRLQTQDLCGGPVTAADRGGLGPQQEPPAMRSLSPFSPRARSCPQVQALGGVCVIPTHPSAWRGCRTIPKAQALGGVRASVFICSPSRNLMKGIIKGKGLTEGRKGLGRWRVPH